VNLHQLGVGYLAKRVESKPISFVGANAGVAMVRSKPSRSGSASLAVWKGKRGKYPEDDKGGEQTRGSHSLNSATHP